MHFLFRWLVLYVVNEYMKSVVITFDALQMADAHLSQQLGNLDRLSEELTSLCGATIDKDVAEPGDIPRVVSQTEIQMGPIVVNALKMRDAILSIGVLAMEMFEDLSIPEANSVIRAMSVIYLKSLNGIMRIKAERNCYNQEFDALPACIPMGLIAMSAIDFVLLIRKHKRRIVSSFDEAEMAKITDEHKALASAVAREPTLKAALEKVSKQSFNKAWQPAGHRFSSLRRFAAGLASVMPTTSRVEADFSFINYRKNEFNAALSDFSLEGVLFARQRKDLESLLACVHD